MKVCNGRQLLIHIDLPDATALTRDQSALMFPPTFDGEPRERGKAVSVGGASGS